MNEFLHIIDGVQYKILETSFTKGEIEIPQYDDTSRIDVIPVPVMISMIRNLLMVNVTDSGLSGGMDSSELEESDTSPITLTDIEIHAEYEADDKSCGKKTTHIATCDDIGYSLFSVKSTDGLSRIGLKLYSDIIHSCAKNNTHRKNTHTETHTITIKRIWIDATGDDKKIVLYDTDRIAVDDKILPYTFEIGHNPSVIDIRASMKVFLNQGDKPQIIPPKPSTGPVVIDPHDLPLDKPTDVKTVAGSRIVNLTWKDPDDISDAAGKAVYAGTVVVRKIGSAPADVTDGIAVYVTTVRNKHTTVPFVDRGLINDTKYYYGIFPYTTKKIYNGGTSISCTPVAPTFITPVITEISTSGLSTINLAIQNDTPGSKLRVVYKAESAPTSITDGTTLDVVGNNLTIEMPLRGAKYYFRAYAYIDKDNSALSEAASIAIGIEILGYRIKKGDDDTSRRVEYTEGAVGMTPAKVDLDTGVFDYGSFANVWFVKENRPVMLRYDKTVAYELDHNNHELKLDGTPSDVSNAAFDGNAMSEFPKIYLKMWEDDTYEYCNFSNVKIDDDYTDDAYIDVDGVRRNVFYMSMFGGSVVNGKMRSLKGHGQQTGMTGQQEINYAEANGKGWDTWTFSRRDLINNLLILMSKSTNSQEAFGNGNHYGNSGLHLIGETSNKGQFTGRGVNIHNGYMKVFYIEDYYGDYWKRIRGLLVNAAGKILIKTKPPYNATGEGYIDLDIVPSGPGSQGDTINRVKMTRYGMIPIASTAGRVHNKYYADGLWFAPNGYAFVGGSCQNSMYCSGALTTFIYYAFDFAAWDVGAALSCDGKDAAS